MPVYKCKKTKRLFIKFDFRGNQYKQRLPEKITKSKAEEIEVAWKHRLIFEANGIEAERNITFEMFLTEYFMPFAENNHSAASFDYDQRICKYALKLWRGKNLNQIRAADIEKFKSIRTATLTQHETERKPATVARELSIISKVFSLAVKNEFLDYNPCTRVEKPKFDNTQDNVLSWENEEKFLAAFESDWARDVCVLVLYTGLRQNDALKLSKFNIDRDRQEIRLLQGKTKRVVIIPMSTKVGEIIDRRWKITSDLLFPSPKTGTLGTSVKKAIIGAVTRAKIPKVTIKDLRRTYATRLGEMNLEASATARLLGHGDLRSVHRYMRGTDNLRNAVENLATRATIVPEIQKDKKVKSASS